jgi:hypothetical protein
LLGAAVDAEQHPALGYLVANVPNGGSVGLSHVEHTHAVTYVEDPACRRQLEA